MPFKRIIGVKRLGAKVALVYSNRPIVRPKVMAYYILFKQIEMVKARIAEVALLSLWRRFRGLFFLSHVLYPCRLCRSLCMPAAALVDLKCIFGVENLDAISACVNMRVFVVILKCTFIDERPSAPFARNPSLFSLRIMLCFLMLIQRKLSIEGLVANRTAKNNRRRILISILLLQIFLLDGGIAVHSWILRFGAWLYVFSGFNRSIRNLGDMLAALMLLQPILSFERPTTHCASESLWHFFARLWFGAVCICRGMFGLFTMLSDRIHVVKGLSTGTVSRQFRFRLFSIIVGHCLRL